MKEIKGFMHSVMNAEDDIYFVADLNIGHRLKLTFIEGKLSISFTSKIFR